MKKDSKTTQDQRTRISNGHGTNGFFLVEPVDARRYGRARSRVESIRRQDLLLRAARPVFYNSNGSAEPEEYTTEAAECSANGRESSEGLSVNGHNESAQPSGSNKDGHAESKSLVVDRHGQDDLPVDYFKLWAIWK